MWLTALHLLMWPAAALVGFGLGVAARKGRLRSPWLAYVLALIPGAGIALAAQLFHIGETPDENPWLGFLVWAAWAALAVYQGWRGPRRPAAAK